MGCVYETIYKCEMTNFIYAVLGMANCPCYIVIATANSLFCPEKGVDDRSPVINLLELESGIKFVSLKWLS